MNIEDYEFYKKFYDDNRIRLLQYDSLRKNFRKLVEDVLGKDYHNMGACVYSCDEECCNDIAREANRSWWSRLWK